MLRTEQIILSHANGWTLAYCDKIGAAKQPAPAPAASHGGMAVPVHGNVAGNVNVFMNSPHSKVQGEKSSPDWWARWGTIFGAIGVIVAIAVAWWQFG